jgi:uncharacterized protein YegJ (DUF2314 family)
MKPSKTAYKRPAKRAVKKRPAKRGDGGNPITDKLLKLKYRINDTAVTEDGWSDDMSNDKRYVQSLINDIRKHGFTKLAPEDGHCCNGLWRKYA